MCNKFTMQLVWHNCKTHPPKEFENNALIITNGKDIYGMSWHRAEGYYMSTEYGLRSPNFSELENWWWADIVQTVQGGFRLIK